MGALEGRRVPKVRYPELPEPSQLLDPPPDPSDIPSYGGYTVADDIRHTNLLLALRLRCESRSQIVEYAKRELKIAPPRVDRLLDAALEKLKERTEHDQRYAKSEQIARLRDSIRRLRTPKEDPDRPGKALPLTEKALEVALRHEALLADIEGTREPMTVRVDATVRTAAVNILLEMSDEQQQALYEKALERKRLAEMALTLPHAAPSNDSKEKLS